MKRRATAAGVLAMVVMAGCVLDRSGNDVPGAGGSGSGAAGPGGGGQGGGGAPPSCGDGIVNGAGETCDEGPQNTVNCDSDCTAPECGDGHLNQNAGEGCDDGNTDNGDGCNSSCVSETCGDMVVDGMEECDDGNDNDNDDCLSNCNLPTCGDSFVHNEGNGTEECDDGNGDNSDDCPDGVNGTCLPASCGDGHLHANSAEVCDDGDSSNNNDCLNTCVPASCGDGFPHTEGAATEQCDDGNNDQHDDCLDSCVSASCGDGFVHNGGGGVEMCDDGNTADTDGCSANCTREAGACCDGDGPGSCVLGPHTIGMNNLGLAIPDNGYPGAQACQMVSFMQAGCGNITDVNVEVGITHGWVGDLVITASNPVNSVRTLMHKPGTTNGNGDGSAMAAGSPVTYDDQAGTSAEDMGANINLGTVCQTSPSACDYFPNPDNLAVYNGGSPGGTWTLCAGDTNNQYTGTLQSVFFHITTQ